MPNDSAQFGAMNSAPPPPENSAELTRSALAGWLAAFAVVLFVAAFVLSVPLLKPRESREFGVIVLSSGIISGFFCLAIAEIIRCLHESSQRLERIEKLLENRRAEVEVAKALQWMVDNWNKPPPTPPA